MKTKLMLTTALLSLALTPCVARAESPANMEEIQAQMHNMMDRISKLEAENANLRANVTSVQTDVKNMPAPAPEKAEKKDLTLPGGTTLKIGGYIKADAIADIGSGYNADFAKFAAIPLDGSAASKKDSSFHMQARQTRLNLTATTPTSIGDVKAFVETDFFGAGNTPLATNASGMQLRQAYGQVGGLLVGQTWSTFADMDAYPESLDYVGPVGMTLVRQVQIRYSDKLDNGFSYSAALENPSSDYTYTGGNTISTYEQVPDAVLALTQTGDWGHWSLRGVARDISIRNDTQNQARSAFGWGAALSATINTFDKDNLKLRAAYGDGLGRYIYDDATSSLSSAVGTTATTTTLHTQEVFAAYAAYMHNWTPELRSNLMGGYTEIDNDTALIGTAQNKTLWSGHLNLIWQPVKAYRVGMEYMHGYRKLENGTKGDLDRVEASFIYPLN